MKLFRNKIIHLALITMLCLAFTPLPGAATMFLQTEAVSGTITAIENNAVELDGSGPLYYPVKPTLTMDLKVGSVVTLLYYVDRQNEKPIKKYVEYAPGRNSLTPKTPPMKKKEKK
jgi:hypothetical protein